MSLEQLTVKLTESFIQGDYETASKILTPIKIELIKYNLLVPTLQTRIDIKDLIITRKILEIGALVSFNLREMNEFANFITQLKPFYEIEQIREESKEFRKLLSLYLILLLTQDDLALFHIEIENFQNYGMSVDDLEKDDFLSIPINFEKWIIDGDFNKIYDILSTEHKFPCSEFNIFKDELLNSMRLNIANNLEKVYKELPLENLKLLLFLKQIDETKQFIENFNWECKNGIVYFNKSETKLNEVFGIIEEIEDEKTIVKNALIYAAEMEKII